MKLVKLEILTLDPKKGKVQFEPTLLNPEVVTRIIASTEIDDPMAPQTCCVYLSGEPGHVHVMGDMYDVSRELQCDVDERIRALQMQLKLKDGIIANLKEDLAKARKG